MSEYPETPELDKRQWEVLDTGKNVVVQDFYDWLHEQGLHICRMEDETDGWGSPRYMPDPRQPEQLMADFFGIDLNKIEAERRAILDHIRSVNQ